MMKLEYNENIKIQQSISSTMFGSNQLFRFDTVSATGSVFPSAADLLGVTSLRYPGGTMTEINFDVAAPDNPPKGVKGEVPYIGATEFLNFAKLTMREVDFVIPTKSAYSGFAAIASNEIRNISQNYIDDTISFVRKLLTQGDSDSTALPDTPIKSIEIGNEYWGGGKMTASEYGKLVNLLLPRLHEVITECTPNGAERPKLLIQVGAPVDQQFKAGIYSNLSFSDRLYLSNVNIINEIVDPQAKIAIGGLVNHYYYNGTSDLLSKDSWSMQSMDLCYNIWEGLGYKDIDYHITEWNVNMNNTVQLGLKGASVLIEQFTYMAELGVDSAFAWPIQDHNNGLVRSISSEVALSPIGAAFKLMSESLIGTTLLPHEIQNETIEVSTFSSEYKVVFFVCSRISSDQHVALDISDVIMEFKSVSGVKLGVNPGEAFDNPLALAAITYLSADDFMIDRQVEVQLAPFEILRIEYSLSRSKNITGSNQDDLLLGDLDADTIRGADGVDTLVGGGGDDSLFGNIGGDRVFGGGGDDIIFGGLGWDTLRGGPGDDVMHGNLGNDLLISISGRDSLYGGFGWDILRGGSDGAILDGGPGKDQLFGLEGDDTLCGGDGDDTLYGGTGADVFILDVSQEGTDKILDFNPASDLIRIRWNNSGGYLLTEADLTTLSFRDGDTPLDLNGRVQIIHSVETGSVYFDPDGEVGQVSPTLIGIVWPSSVLDVSDFSVELYW